MLPDGTQATLGFLIEDYLAHLEHHLNQVFAEQITPPSLPDRWKIGTEEAMAILRAHPDGKSFATLLEHGNTWKSINQSGLTLQKPHDQDEIYVVISGTGTFFNNGERRPFAAGDLIFVPARGAQLRGFHGRLRHLGSFLLTVDGLRLTMDD